MTAALAAARAAVLRRRIRWVVAGTIAYNVVEAAVALTAGTLASSAALIGFGLDSVVEVLSAAAVAWQFSAPDHRRREHAALRLIAFSFFGLAAFVTFDALRALLGGVEAAHSPAGIVLAAASLAIMPTVSWIERRAGRELGSATAIADSRQTLICAYLSAALLVGLVLNASLGWWWADPLAALVIAGFAVREGREAWHGDGCCATSGALLHGQEEACACDDHPAGASSPAIGDRRNLL
ncbi:cation diffusion facilitator family transporter [Demequina silvatica]|uniref:cation diffusion facilitator family transporter n=1 Tax=Demequina silvatica TaxID=1638988 RepID=UPI00078674A8|nr:cation transporter [Demequina silvatica]